MFVIGDKVRVLDIPDFQNDKNFEIYKDRIGEVGIIKNQNFFHIVMFEDGEWLNFADDEIEKVEE